MIIKYYLFYYFNGGREGGKKVGRKEGRKRCEFNGAFLLLYMFNDI